MKETLPEFFKRLQAWESDHVDRYNAAMETARERIAALPAGATGQDIDDIMKPLFSPLMTDALNRPSIMEVLR